MSRTVLMLPGDGIGPEIVAEAEKVLHKVNDQFDLGLGFESGLVGGAAIDATDSPLPDETLEKATKADAILLGAVGGPQWDSLPMARRPEKGLLGLRSNLGVVAEAGSGIRPGHPDRPGADWRHLFWPAARRSRTGKRRASGLQHLRLYRIGNSSYRPGCF